MAFKMDPPPFGKEMFETDGKTITQDWRKYFQSLFTAVQQIPDPVVSSYTDIVDQGTPSTVYVGTDYIFDEGGPSTELGPNDNIVDEGGP